MFSDQFEEAVLYLAKEDLIDYDEADGLIRISTAADPKQVAEIWESDQSYSV